MPDSLFLYKLDDETLESIIESSDEERHKYFLHLIRLYFPGSSKELKANLMSAYMSSFILEYIVRNHEGIAESFTCVYTPHGLIREVVNDLYKIEEEYRYQIN